MLARLCNAERRASGKTDPACPAHRRRRPDGQCVITGTMRCHRRIDASTIKTGTADVREFRGKIE
ncbi:hypothetical protein [Xanthomonas fragariae]|uniref:hypothetical protein n=1 Tax=Xanthomonas fragariae TaxID=48664 RepID=UPI00131F02B5|nr:hypothetical protein [Xanthomonas fragariae]